MTDIQTYAALPEEEMRDTEVPRIESPEELAEFARLLTEREHDYGTCVYAMSALAVAGFNLAAGKLGVTGFQASCADMNILRRTRGLKWGKVIDYGDLLYPQHREKFDSLTFEGLLAEHRIELAKKSQELLDERTTDPAPRVLAHWKRLAANGADNQEVPA